jgi:hypothetical protein
MSLGVISMVRSVRDIAKVRQARDDGRPTEDDLAKQHLGPLGIKGKPDKPKLIDDNELQISSHIDPGHPS